jgi:protein-tyrosine phosphatase
MHILFVCTGNIFRSMSAEYCLKKYLEENNIEGIVVESAGTGAIPQKMNSVVKKTLISLGINPSKHKQKPLTDKHFEKFDLIVAMHKNHQDFIKEYFGKDVPLFDEICYGKKVSVLDNNQLIPDWQDHIDAINRFMEYTVKFINNSIPKFVKNYSKFLK